MNFENVMLLVSGLIMIFAGLFLCLFNFGLIVL